MSATKKVLIITYYWPPAGGPGVQRWLKFVTYFKKMGIDPVVYIPENPEYPIVDKNIINEVPEGITIVKHPIKEPYRYARLFSKKHTKTMSSGVISKKKNSLLQKLMLYIRGNYFIPDARVNWVQPSIKFLSNYILQNPIETIITTGPPHSLHLIGKGLQSITNTKWIADFRDPWTTIHYHDSLQLTDRSQKKHKQLEKEVLDTADLVTVTSPRTQLEFEALTQTPVKVVTNGYEPVKGIIPQIDNAFSIAHIGSLLTERNPEILWKVLAEICKENPSFKKDLKLTFAGVVSEEVQQSLQKNQLLTHAVFKGYVAHREAIQLQHNTQLLLLLEIDRPETRAIIPGKLFEYLNARRPILAIGPEGSDVATILEETNAGAYFNPAQKEALKKQLFSLFAIYNSQKTLPSLSTNIDRYSREATARQMLEAINTKT